MTPAMRSTTAIADFLVLKVIALPFLTNWQDILWYGLCIILAFVLRLGIERKNNNLSTQVLINHAVFTISWCFFSILLWKAGVSNFIFSFVTLEIWLFFNSFFATFLVGQGEILFEKGFTEWVRIKVKSVQAKEDDKS